MKVLVTGGAGYIGSACVKALCDEGYAVVALDNLSNGDRKYVDARAVFAEGDILDEEFLEGVFAEHVPAAVVHMAALKSVADGEADPERYFRNNVTGTLNVLAGAARHGVRHVLFSSSALVYAPTEEGIYTEADSTESANVYGGTKIMAEKLITEFARTGKIPVYTIFRYFNVAGDVGLGFREKDPQNLLPLLVESAQGGRPLCVFGNDYATPDGTCVRDYVHVADIVKAHVLALRDGVSGIFNLGTNSGTSVLEMIDTFSRVSGKKLDYSIGNRRAGDPAVLRADAAKANAVLGWKPASSLDEILRSSVE